MASTSSKILLVLVVIVALVGLAAAGVYFNTPELVAARALENMVDDFVSRDEIKPFKETFNGGSVAFYMGEYNIDGVTYFEDGKVGGKMYFSTEDPVKKTKNAFMLDDVHYEYGDIKLAGQLYADSNTVYISETEYFEEAYGINLNTLVDDLANSIFAPDSGSEYALDDDIYNKLTTAIEAMGQDNQVSKDAKELSNSILDDIKKIIMENVTIEAEYTKERLQGEKKDVRVITITVTEDDLADMVMDLYEYLCNDEKIPEFLDTYETIFMLFGDELYGEDFYDKDLYDSLGEAYEEELEAAREDVEDFCDDIEFDEDLTIKIVTPRFTASFLKLEISSGKDTYFTIDCGAKGMKNTDKISIKNPETGLSFSYEIKENSESAIKVELDFTPYKSDYRTETYKITLKVDKDAETYRLDFENHYTYRYFDYYTDTYDTHEGEDVWCIKGNWITNGDATTFTIASATEKLNDNVYETEFSDLSITFDRSDDMPDPLATFKTIADITEDDIEALITKIEDLEDSL